MTNLEFSKQLGKLEEMLMGFALKLTHNQDDAKDLFQETASKAFWNIKKYRPETNFRAWTVTIMRNTFINEYRRRKLRKLDTEPIENHTNTSAEGKGYEEVESNLMLQELNSLVSALDVSFSKPFKMHHDGYKYEEIAKEMCIPVGTVKSRIFFARRKLKDSVNQLYA